MAGRILTRVARSSTALLVLAVASGVDSELHGQARPTMRAHAVTTPITVDGVLDEAAWQEADSISDFKQFEPSEGAEPSQRTEVRVLYGPSALYVGAMLYDTNPAGISATLGRRDDFNRADWFLVSLDAYLDGRTAYTFAVNAAGVQFDAVRSGGGGGFGGPGGGGGNAPRGMDPSWNAVWSSHVQITPRGWVVEMAIPYSMLRFGRAPEQTWGVHFSRRIPRLSEQAEWPLVPRTERSNLVAQFGYLTDIAGIEPRRNVQISPYSVARLQTSEDSLEPGTMAAESEIDVGGDVKIGLGPNVTLDATINPDFGQVDADPAVLNLTAFENVFQEKRPFFLEGSQTYEFRTGPGELLYTRRIGAANRIIGAAKLSGRTSKGLSFGVLGATTGDDFDPSENYGVGRVVQQLGEFSTLGGIVTLFDGPEDEGRRRSIAAGADWDIRFFDNQYGIEGFGAFTDRTLTVGDTDSEAGFAGKVWLNKRQGAWTGRGGLEVYSDEFNPNDVGQIRSVNSYVALANIDHDFNGGQAFGPFQRADMGIRLNQRVSYDEQLNQGLDVNFHSRWTLRSFQSFGVGAGIENPFGGYDLYETRGLGPWAAPSSFNLSLDYDSDDRRDWTIGPRIELTQYEEGGREYELSLRGNWSASNHLSLEADVRGDWENDVLAWSSNETFLRTTDGWLIGTEEGLVENTDPTSYTAFGDGDALAPILAPVDPVGPNRYYVPVFGARDSRSLDLTGRGTYTFTPNLSIQLYTQLFFAGGRYDDMQILQDRDHLADFDNFPKRDDFAFSNFQSNAVLRWEYRPGSTFYVVWTQGRHAEDRLNPLAPWGPSPYDLSLGDQLGDTFDVYPDNVLLIKLNYTFIN